MQTVIAATSMTDFIDLNIVMLWKGFIFLVIALIGAVFHALKKWLKGDISSIWVWFTTNPKATATTVLVILGAAFTTAFTAQLEGLTFSQLALLSFTSGFSADSVLNNADVFKDKELAKTKENSVEI
jgi:hypothetical protein